MTARAKAAVRSFSREFGEVAAIQHSKVGQEHAFRQGCAPLAKGGEWDKSKD
jgi:hypothetical protein